METKLSDKLAGYVSKFLLKKKVLGRDASNRF